MLYSFFMPAAKMKERLALPYVMFVVQDILLFLHLLTFTCVHFYLIYCATRRTRADVVILNHWISYLC